MDFFKKDEPYLPFLLFPRACRKLVRSKLFHLCSSWTFSLMLRSYRFCSSQTRRIQMLTGDNTFFDYSCCAATGVRFAWLLQNETPQTPSTWTAELKYTDFERNQKPSIKVFSYFWLGVSLHLESAVLKRVITAHIDFFSLVFILCSQGISVGTT